MSKQYTFKTTKDTEWLEGILDNILSPQRSSFIREMLILGIRTSRSHKSNLSDLSNFHGQTCQTDKTDKLDFHIKKEEPTIEDINNKLDSIKF